MNKLAISIAISIIITSVGAYLVLQKPSKIETDVKQAVIVTQDDISKYVDYSKEVLNKNVSNRRVLFFYASWCSTCRPADANFRENMSMIPENLTVIRVNFNDPDTDQEEKDLAKKYGVTYQHTFVQIDKDGNELTKWNGGQLNELLSKFK